MELQHQKRCYLFNGFVLDVQERRLKKGERNIYLRPKTLDVLICLVERSGRLVAKNELLDTLWQDVEVTENVLTHCITELRDAFKDDKKNPRFIETVQRAGYRFITPVEKKEAPGKGADYEEELSAISVAVIEEETENGNVVNSSHPTQLIPPVSGELPAAISRPVSFFLRNRWILWFLLAVAGVIAVILIGYRALLHKSTLAFAERNWVLIADFDNFTGQRGLDVALRTALEQELAQSSYLNVVPPGRITDTLRLMKSNLDIRITEAVGRDICLRDGGIRALLCGNIHRVGEMHSVVLQLIDPSTGVHVAVLEQQAATTQEVLPAIGRLARELRQHLGEPLNLISKSPASLERVTTSSLEALALYSKGLALIDQFSWAQAETYFDQAIVLDPEFAAAHSWRGLARFLLGRDSSADLQRSLELSPTASLRERFYIQSIDALVNQEDASRSINFCESLLQQFPDDYWAHEWLSWLYFWAGNYQRWQEHQAACRRIRPNSPQPLFHAGWVDLLHEGNAEKADANFKKVLELKPDFDSCSVQASKGYLHWMHGEVEQAAAEFASFRVSKMGRLSIYTQISARMYLARYYLFIGRVAEALVLLETNRDMTFPVKGADLAKTFTFERALIYEQLSDSVKFEQLMKDEIQNTVGLDRVRALGWLAVVKARAGQTETARALQREIEKEDRMPPVSFWYPPLMDQLELGKKAYSLQIDGEILLRDKKFDEALAHFQKVLKVVPDKNALFNTILPGINYLLAQQATANACTQSGDWNCAARACEAILQHKPLCIGTPGASAIWIDALKSISLALENAGRPAEAARYREEYLRLRPPSR